MKHEGRWYNSARHTLQQDPITYCDMIAEKFGAKPNPFKHPTLAWRLVFLSHTLSLSVSLSLSVPHHLQQDPITYCDMIAEKFGAKPSPFKHPTLAWR